MKPGERMREKEKALAALGWRAFEWTQEHILMGRNGAACKIDKRGGVRYLRKDEIDELAKRKGLDNA